MSKSDISFQKIRGFDWYLKNKTGHIFKSKFHLFFNYNFGEKKNIINWDKIEIKLVKFWFRYE